MKIGNIETTSLIINLICMKLFLTFPRQLLSSAGNGAWLTSVFVTVIALLVFYITSKIYRTNKTVIDISEEIGGKPFKILTGMLLFGVILFNMVFTLRIFPESVRIILLHNTPMTVIVLLLCIGIAFGTYNGIEAIARITSFFLPTAAVILLFFIIMHFPHFNAKNIAPILGKGFKSIFTDGFGGITLFSDIIVLNMLLPMCKSKKEAFKSGMKAIAISGLTMTVILIVLGLVFPRQFSENFIMPVYQLTRLVSIGDFFSRIEAFFEFIWSIAMFLYTSVYVYTLCLILKKSFDLKYYKPLVAPVITICAAVSYIPDSLINAMNLYTQSFIYIYAVTAAFPIVYGTLERIRNK